MGSVFLIVGALVIAGPAFPSKIEKIGHRPAADTRDPDVDLILQCTRCQQCLEHSKFSFSLKSGSTGSRLPGPGLNGLNILCAGGEIASAIPFNFAVGPSEPGKLPLGPT